MTPPPAPSKASFPLAWTIALRELRAGLSGLAIFVLCIALGVAAIAAIGSLSAAFNDALVRNGRLLVGGDLSFQLIHRRADAAETKALQSLGTMSQSANLRAMARNATGKAALVELKAVDDAFPLFGKVQILAPKGAADLWRKPGVALVEPGLLDRLGLKIGDPLKIGNATLIIGGTLGKEPDRLANALALGPRVLISLASLRKTHLIQPGSLVRWTYRIKLPGNEGMNESALAEAQASILKRFPQGGFSVRNWTNPNPALRRDTRRFTQFIGLVGLTALLLGGIGVGNAIASYMTKKREVIAIFKTLGASSRLVLYIYLIQALLLTAAGILAGLVLGAFTPAILSALYGSALPIALDTGPHPLPLLLAATAGLLTMLLFVLWPLGRASAVPPAALLRAHLAENGPVRGTMIAFALGSAASGLALFLLALATSSQPLITASICLGILASFILFSAYGWLLAKLAGLAHGLRPATLALALARIAGPSSLARTVSVSLGIGLGLLVAVALVDRALITELKGDVSASAPAYYFLDINPAHLNAFEATIKKAIPKASLAEAPMLRGRIVAVNGIPVEKLKVSPDERWVLNGDRGLTYTDTVPKSSKVVAGKWWGKNYKGPPLVSFDDQAARALGLKIGDPITINVLGRNITARVANLRRIDWNSLSINFIMVFPPVTLEAAPHRLLATLQLPKTTKPAVEARLIQALADTFPRVTAIKVGDLIKAAQDMIEKVMTAIEVSAGLTVAIGAIVLAGAISASQQRRKYLAVLYKTLGATRRRILTTELIEFASLGLAIATAAIGTATLTAYLLCRFAFHLPFRFSPAAAAETALLALILVLGLGAVATWKVLSAKAANYLRAE